MSKTIRLSAQQTREKTLSGKALLVCGYEEDSKFIANKLEGAIPWMTFQSRLPQLSKDQEIIFYCA